MSEHEDDAQLQNAPTPESHGQGATPHSNPGGSGEIPATNDAEDAPEESGANGPSGNLTAIDQIQGALESIFLAADGPVSRTELGEVFEETEERIVDQALERLQLEYSGTAKGIHLQAVADGFEFRTNPSFDEDVRALVEASPVSLSRAALETLAIVAYRQPVTRAEIEDIRGVNSSGVLRTLDQCELVRVVGRLDDLGRPHVYGTTERFLEHFGLEALTDLPTLSEDEHQALEELYDEELEKFDEEFE